MCRITVTQITVTQITVAVHSTPIAYGCSASPSHHFAGSLLTDGVEFFKAVF